MKKAKVLFLHQTWMGFEIKDYEILKNNFSAHELLVYKDVFWRIPQIIKSIWDSDLLFCWFAYRAAIIPILIAKIFRKKIVVVMGGWECASQPENDYGAMRPGIKFLFSRSVVRAIVALADKIIAVSSYNQEEIRANLKIIPEKLSLIYLGVPVNYCLDKDEIYEKEQVVLTVANVTKESFKRKGIDIFIQSAKSMPDVKFILAGEISKEFKDYLKINSPSNLEITGFLSDANLENVYKKAKVYVQVSRHEQFGFALAEAMAYGCLPVVSKKTAIPEVVGDNGYYVSHPNVEETTKAIRMALQQDNQKGVLARERIREKFPLDKREKQIVKLIEKLVSTEKQDRQIQENNIVMKPKREKIAIFINAYFYRNKGSYYTDDNTIIFCLKIVEQFEKIIIFAPVIIDEGGISNDFYRVDDSRAEIMAIPHYNGSTYALIKNGVIVIPLLFKTLIALQDKIDIIWQVDCPNPLNLVFDLFAAIKKIPIIFSLRLDIGATLKIKNQGIKKYFSIIFAGMIDSINKIFFNTCPVLVTGERLYIAHKNKNNLVYKIFENLIETKNIMSGDIINGKRGDDCLKLIGIGRLEKQKGFEYLLDAMRILISEGSFKGHLTIIGSGPEEASLREKIRRYKIEGYVSLVGFIKHGRKFFEYMDKADIFVQPSLEEGVPKTIFEAMARGIPIIASRVGGLPYVLEEEKNALMVNPADSNAIAKAILRYKDDSALFKKVALNNLAYVQNFVLEKQRDNILKIIKEA